MLKSPYQNRPSASFWKYGVASSKVLVPDDLYKKKWTIGPSDQIATAGSCFAQHIGRYLSRNDFKVMNVEPSPFRLTAEDQVRFGFSIYSARYGNIYTTRQLLQLAKEALSEYSPDNIVWINDNGKFVDALRPGVEPEGLSSLEEVLAHRKYHLGRVREMFETMDLMVFTMGLTEAWVHRTSSTVYPTAPGTIAGQYDPDVYSFKNFSFQEVMNDFLEFRRLVKSRNRKNCRFLLTVSPVPLTATATDNHVMLATVYSKSVLRAVAGELSAQYEDIDYFPSYEIITNPWSSTMFYEENLRSVTKEGVTAVMQAFFEAHFGNTCKPPNSDPHVTAAGEQSGSLEDDVVCEEAILEAFGMKV